MFDSASRSDGSTPPHSTIPAAVRGDSEIHASFVFGGTRTQLGRTFERGALRLRYPRANGTREAVIVNTGGGITGGDRLRVALEIGEGATAVVTSQAAEKIYRSDGPPSAISVRATLGEDARLDWLPQETILYDQASAERTVDIDLALSSRLTLLECVVLGRIAHGETLQQAHWRDRWRIRRSGKLVLAESVRMSGSVSAMMERPSVGGGAHALATLVHIALDAEQRLAEVRLALADAACPHGASAWNGMLIVRIAAADAQDMRKLAMRAAIAVTGRPMPRAWAC